MAIFIWNIMGLAIHCLPNLVENDYVG